MNISDLKNPQLVTAAHVPPDTTQNTVQANSNNWYQNLTQGFVKGGASTLLGVGSIGNKIQQGLGGIANSLGANFSPEATGQTSPLNPNSTSGQTVQNYVKPQGTAQNVGFGAEKFAEFFAPASSAAKAESYVNTLSNGIASPLGAAVYRTVGKGVVQGLASGLVTAVQSGGDMKKAADTALTAGFTRGAITTIGEGSRAIRLPERLYSTVFKNTASDMMQELKTENLVNIQKNDPARYVQLVQKGVVKPSPNGPVLNETLAKQALDNGLRGSIRNMARTVINGTHDSEIQVQDIAKNYTGTVDLAEPQFQNVLGGISKRYQDVGFNEISNEADRLSAVLKANGGKVDGGTALDIRRLLDRARIASSYDAPTNKLSLGQANLKTLADTARARLNEIPGMGEAMKVYSFHIEALDTLAKEAARRGNNQALSLIDSLFLSSAFGGNNAIPGLTAGMLRKILMSGQGMTSLAQSLNNSIAGPVQSGVTGAASNLVSSQLNQQQ